MLNVHNGLQVLLAAGFLALCIVVSMTILAVTGSTIPTAFPDALIALVSALAGAGAVHLSTAVTNSKNGSSSPPSGG